MDDEPPLTKFSIWYGSETLTTLLINALPFGVRKWSRHNLNYIHFRD